MVNSCIFSIRYKPINNTNKNLKYFFLLHVTFIMLISFRYHWISQAIVYFRATHWTKYEKKQERRRKLPTDFFCKWFCWKVVFVGTAHNEKFGNTRPLKMVYDLVRKVINTTHHKLMLLYWLWLQHSFATEESEWSWTQ